MIRCKGSFLVSFAQVRNPLKQPIVVLREPIVSEIDTAKYAESRFVRLEVRSAMGAEI